jgi:hypothetical protein
MVGSRATYHFRLTHTKGWEPLLYINMPIISFFFNLDEIRILKFLRSRILKLKVFYVPKLL